MKQRWQKVVAHWNQFFFEPTSTATIGLFRIAFGCTMFVSILGKIPVRNIFYSADGLVPQGTTDPYFPGPRWLYFNWIPDHDPALLIYFLALLLVAFLFTVGFKTRLTGILVYVGLMSLSNRNFFVDNSGDDLMRNNAFFLMFAEAGAAYSIDRWLRVRRGIENATELPKRAPWAQRMIQLQLAYLYLNTAYLKLPGEEWRDGTAIYYALNYIELRRFELKPLFYYLWQIKLMTYLVMVAEFSAGTLIWLRRFRYPVLVAAMILHIGINLTMQFPVFQYVMMASLLNFIYPDDAERWIVQLQSKLRMIANRFFKRGASSTVER